MENNNVTIEELIEQGNTMEDLYIADKVKKEFYQPSESFEYYDGEKWYNVFGQTLREPEEYNNFDDEYTPFGDE